MEKYTNEVTERDRKRESVFERVDVLGKNLFINESLDRTINELESYINGDSKAIEVDIDEL